METEAKAQGGSPVSADPTPPPKRRVAFDADRLLGVSALVVGLGSLFVVVYQTHLTRQAQHASVRPYLYIQLMANTEATAVLLTNSGIGPALVDDVRVKYQGRDIVGDPYDFFTSQRPELGLALNVDKVIPGRLIPAGSTIQVLGSNTERERLLVELLRLFEIAEVPRSWYATTGTAGAEKAVIEVTFSSVYGDRWRVRSDRIVPEGL
jgi:hypothetical protein